jgi:hypothetical protein
MRGVLLARSIALLPDPTTAESCEMNATDLFPNTPSVQLYEKPVTHLTSRELRDTVEACQLHIFSILQNEELEDCNDSFLRLFARFGVLANAAFPEEMMDDKSSVTNIPTDQPTQQLFIYTCKALRTHVDTFYVLFRCIAIKKNASVLEVCTNDNAVELMHGRQFGRICEKYVHYVKKMIKHYHVEASIDAFNIIQQMFFLAPAQRLIYMHNFSGMFNDISQVTYFHYPDYVRSPQIEPHKMENCAMNTLPCFGKIIPQLRIVYDDEINIPLGAVKPTDSFWILSARRVYLWDARSKRIWTSAGAFFL